VFIIKTEMLSGHADGVALTCPGRGRQAG
jgi:hypothetical protein